MKQSNDKNQSQLIASIQNMRKTHFESIKFSCGDTEKSNEIKKIIKPFAYNSQE